MNRSIGLIAVLIISSSVKADWIENPNRYLIKTTNVENVLSLLKSKSHQTELKVERWGQPKANSEIFAVESTTPFPLASLAIDLKNDSSIEWMASVRSFEGDPRESLVNDPQFSKQYHHQMIHSEEAWSYREGESEVLVAVTDDGFDLNHQDLKSSLSINTLEIPNNNIDDDNNGFIDDVQGWGFAENDSNPMSDSSNGAHGTHVAGIIAGTWNNGIGITGMGPQLKVLPIKFYGSGRWTNEIVLKSYQYAALRGAKIVNTSYNIDGLAEDQIYLEGVDTVYRNGGLIFNSAGNSGAHQSARTKVEKIILVSSVQSGSKTNNWDVKSSFSNYGNGVDIAAPGNPILSLGRGNKYMEMSGTSMASPVAAASMAYLWSVYPEKSRREILGLLTMSSDNINAANSRYIDKLGAGRINLARAVQEKLNPLKIQSINHDTKTKILTLHLWGVMGDSFRGHGNLVVTNQKGQESALTPINSYELGTNELRYSVGLSAGEYEIRAVSSGWKDAFGRELDGNSDGQVGDDWIETLKI